jgi:hypothetical protein
MDDVRSGLIGARQVKSYQDRASVTEQWRHTYGAGVDGLIVYDESSWLAVQVVGHRGEYDAYFGRFNVLEATPDGSDVRGVVIHEIVATSLPQLMSAEPERFFRLSGAKLILGDEKTRRRACERVASGS